MTTNIFFAFLSAMTWKGSLLVAAMLLIVVLFGRWIPAAWRYALLFVALLRLVIPAAPSSSMSVFNLFDFGVRAPFITVVPAPAESDVTAVTIPRQALHPTPLRGSSNTTKALIGIWAAGFAFALFRVGRRSMRVSRRLARFCDVTRPDLLELLDAARASLGVRRAVRLATTPAVDAPSLHGWFRPVLLLPPHLVDSFSPDQLRFIFLHEIAHLRRADVPLNWFLAAVHALHWFNPLVWFAVARLQEDRELACDALALEHLGNEERSEYGQTVLQLLHQFRAPSLVPALVGMSSTHSQIKRRIQMIATFRNRTRHSMLFAAATLVLALVTLTDATAGERHLVRTRKVNPEAKATMDRLSQKMDLELTSASIDEVLNAITNRTGVSIDTKAIDDEARQKRLTITGKELPAHLLLIHALGSVGLSAEFNADGVVVTKGDDDEREPFVIFVDKDGDDAGDISIDVQPHDGPKVFVEKNRIVIRHVGTDGDATEDGAKRKLRIHTEDGEQVGTLEIEVKKQ